jgi:hypothetical protein
VWLLKIGALVKVSVRRIQIRLAGAFLLQAECAFDVAQISRLSRA